MTTGLLFACRLGNVELDRPVGELPNILGVAGLGAAVLEAEHDQSLPPPAQHVVKMCRSHHSPKAFCYGQPQRLPAHSALLCLKLARASIGRSSEGPVIVPSSAAPSCTVLRYGKVMELQ